MTMARGRRGRRLESTLSGNSAHGKTNWKIHGGTQGVIRRAILTQHTKVGVGYNIQIAVDAKHKMIVEQAVSNDVLDMGLLQCTAGPAREILEVKKIDVVADKGYFRTEDIASCEEAGLTPHVPRPQRGTAVKNGFFRKDEFR